MATRGWTVGRRIRAAMSLAGIESFGDLAERISHEGLGERTLRKIADDGDDSRTAQRLDLIAIAGACGLPVEFFTVDYGSLAQTNGRVAAELNELRAQQAEDSVRLAQLEQSVRALAARDRRGPQAEGGQQ